MFTYKPLWKTLIDKDITKTELQKMIECSPNTITVMKKNEYVSMNVLDRICNALDCNICDVVEHIRE
jgi:putative transcriptional regulator